MLKITLLLCAIFFAAIITNAQLFIRVFNAEGRKIAKGRVDKRVSTDSVMVIKYGESFDAIPVTNIAYIKTKHSIGNNMLVGTLITAPLFAAIFAANTCSDCLGNDSPENAIAAGFASGIAIGAIAGGVTAIFKNSHQFMINGDVQKWHIVRPLL